MGVSPASEAFQEFVRNILGHLDFLLIYVDDLLIMSTNMEEHLQQLETVFQILEEKDIVLKESKCEFAVTYLNFSGILIGPEEIQPNPAKVQAILKLNHQPINPN